ncbi:MAG: hypothetical protein U0587_00325 [Candidatus Binatia bacterium]
MAEPRTYICQGKTYHNERDLVVALLDSFRAGETFGAEVLQAWLNVCQLPALRGGLRTVVEREAWHARVLAQRLQELDSPGQGQFAPETRQATLRRMGAATISDVDKLREIAGLVTGPSDPVAELRHAAEQIEEDQETRALLLTLLDDEDATVRWLRDSYRHLIDEADELG